MSRRQELAHDYFKKGYSCGQATIMAFSDLISADEDTLLRLTSAFGGGFAKTRNICGTVSAMGMLVGALHKSSGDIEQDKKDVYKKTRELMDKFSAINSSCVCGELLRGIKDITKDYIPSPRTAEYYAKRPCTKFVTDMVAIIEEEYNIPDIE